MFASYLLGHFAFLLSSALDELIYDRVRGWTDWGQISKRLAKGKPPITALPKGLSEVTLVV